MRRPIIQILLHITIFCSPFSLLDWQRVDPTVKAKKLRVNSICPTGIQGTNFISNTRPEDHVKEQYFAFVKTVPLAT